MRRLLRFGPAAAGGPLVGLAVFAGLTAADPGVGQDNPWVLHFRAAGCETHLYRTSTRISERIAVPEWRGKFDEPRFEGTRLLTLDVDRVPIQILELPTKEAARELAARKLDRRAFRVSAEGRHACIVRPLHQQGLWQPVAAGPADRVIALFQEGARRIP